MSTTEPGSDHLSVDDISAAIELMTDADWVRLKKVALRYGQFVGLEADDVLQIALTRALEGRRKCPYQIDMVRFLAEVMRSVASDHVKAEKRKPELRLVSKLSANDDLVEYDFLDPAPDAEAILANEQEAERILKQVLALFEDDLITQTIIEGHAEDMEARELRKLTGLDKKTYASKRRLIRRRIDSVFWKGLTHE